MRAAADAGMTSRQQLLSLRHSNHSCATRRARLEPQLDETMSGETDLAAAHVQGGQANALMGAASGTFPTQSSFDRYVWLVLHDCWHE